MAKNKEQMSFMDHLEDLRWMLIRSTVAILVMATASYFFIDFWDAHIFSYDQ